MREPKNRENRGVEEKGRTQGEKRVEDSHMSLEGKVKERDYKERREENKMEEDKQRRIFPSNQDMYIHNYTENTTRL